MNKNREQGTGNREQGTGNREQGTGNREQLTTIGCPSLGIPKLPGGFDGTEPGKTVLEEAQAKVEQCVVRQRQKLTQIADLALAAEAKSNNANVKLGSKYLENATAIAEIRKLVEPGLTFEDEIEGRDKPIDPTAPEMKRGKDAKQEAFNRRTWSFCDGLFPIIHIDTQEGFMALCKINGRLFKESVTQEDGPDGPVWTGYIYDKGVCVCMVGSMGKGKTATKLMTHAAFMAYVKQLSGGGAKYHNRRGFLRQNAARVRAAAKAAGEVK